MKYHDITHDDMKNGDGLRVVLWVSGCDHHCPGCQNPITWDPDDGLEWSYAQPMSEIMTDLRKDYVSGLTISGGDPFHPNNVLTVMGICRYVKQALPDKTIWIYTGYRFDDLLEMIDFPESIFSYIDVLVDGPYEEQYRDVNYPWAGSTNQRVIDIRKTFAEGKVVLYGNNQERRDPRTVGSSENCHCCS